MPSEARLLLEDIFNITGRGIVFTGELSSGDFRDIGTGGIASFEIQGETLERRIVSFTFGNPPDRINKLGVFINCESQDEITRIRNWQFQDGTSIKLVFS